MAYDKSCSTLYAVKGISFEGMTHLAQHQTMFFIVLMWIDKREYIVFPGFWKSTITRLPR
jgi:hypothetical protein